jgi:hypothetical protein
VITDHGPHGEDFHPITHVRNHIHKIWKVPNIAAIQGFPRIHAGAGGPFPSRVPFAALQDGPMNGREARESGLRLKA